MSSVESAQPVRKVNGPPPSGFRSTYSPSGTIRESLFGERPSSEWRPLRFGTLFDEGWDEPWVAPPSSPGGPARQGWLNAPDGDFYRLGYFTYGFSDIYKHEATGHLGQFTLYTPLSRRLMLITNTPFVRANDNLGTGPNRPQRRGGGRGRVPEGEAGPGDVTLTPRVMLIDTRDFSMVAQTSVRVPTGQTSTEGQTILTPALQFWSNPFGRLTVRGGAGVDVALNRAAGNSHFLGQTAVGYTLTDHDVPLVGDFTPYVSGLVDADLSDASNTLATVTAGFRNHVGRDWYLLGALETPVTGTRTFDSMTSFAIMKNW